jgi:hypothetical protein
MTNPEFKLWYRQVLRTMKEKGLTVDDLPVGLRKALLQAHLSVLRLEAQQRDRPA